MNNKTIIIIMVAFISLNVSMTLHTMKGWKIIQEAITKCVPNGGLDYLTPSGVVCKNKAYFPARQDND